eukprot:5553118-Pleurochrysis_carterae.AAC.1
MRLQLLLRSSIWTSCMLISPVFLHVVQFRYFSWLSVRASSGCQVRDFSMIFDAYTQFEESLISAQMEQQMATPDDDVQARTHARTCARARALTHTRTHMHAHAHAHAHARTHGHIT